MKNELQPAVGFVDNRSSSYEDSDIYYGLSKLAVLANTAPNSIPDWFNHVPATKPEFKLNFDSLESDDERLIRNWQRDPCYDLPEHLSYWQKAREKYNVDVDEWNRSEEESRYFQWKIYYAKALLKHIEIAEGKIATGDNGNMPD